MKQTYSLIALTALLSCTTLPKKENPTFHGCDFSFILTSTAFEDKTFSYIGSKNPKIKIHFPIYEYVSQVSENWIRAKKNGKFGFIDTDDKTVFIFQLSFASDFVNGHAVYRDGESRTDPKGYIDKKGNLLGDLYFEDAFLFRNGSALVKQAGKFGIIDTKGKFIVPPKYDYLSPLYENWAIFKRDEHQGLVSNKGVEKKFVHDEYEIKNTYYEGSVAFQRYEKTGMMDSNFKVIIPPNYEYLGLFHEGLVRFKLNGKWGFLDQAGNVIIEPIYDSEYDFEEGYAVVEINNQYGIINKQGKYLLEPKFSSIHSFSNGIAVVRENEKRGFINTNAEWLVPPIFEDLNSYHDGIIGYSLNGRWGIINVRDCIQK
ncbi:WG repeat-containing protein [Leptospira chreensis]|uniref:WG repeat-containing protein n=1 Tax=Leptospira chreensis TaxID=2810035 RepID=UPI001E347C84|nr:WG repeat-containing protein [Leptospira chreensis]